MMKAAVQLKKNQKSVKNKKVGQKKHGTKQNKFKEEIKDNLEVNLNQSVEEVWGQLRKCDKQHRFQKQQCTKETVDYKRNDYEDGGERTMEN